MNSIISSPYEQFDINSIHLGNPYTQNGVIMNDIFVDSNNNFYIQTPKCISKDGLVESATNTNTKLQIDLIFTKQQNDFLDFIGKVEEHIQGILKEKKELWFATEMTDEDIEHSFSTSFRYIKKHFHLRALNTYKKYDIVNNNTNNLVRIFDENRVNKLVCDVKKDKELITIIHVRRIKCSSFSFTIEYNVKQILITNTEEQFNQCLIALPPSTKNTTFTAGQDNVTQDTTVSNDDEDITELINLEKRSNTDITENDNGEDIVETEVDNEVAIHQEIETDNTTENEKNSTDEEKSTEIIVETDILNKELENKELENKELENKEVENEDIIDIDVKNVDNLGNIEEVEIIESGSNETISLKDPTEVVLEIYKEARRKAKEIKKRALAAYLEAEKIRETYMLDNIESSDDDEEISETNL
jgi:hypothetical protein